MDVYLATDLSRIGADLYALLWLVRPLCGQRTYTRLACQGMRTTADSEVLFEGYACTYHKARLCAYASIAPPVIGRFSWVRYIWWRRGISLRRGETQDCIYIKDSSVDRRCVLLR
jgi:hypothetical protein